MFVLVACTMNPRDGAEIMNILRGATVSSHLWSISLDLQWLARIDTMANHYIPPVGSSSAGKTSLPQIDQAATAVTIPAKPAY